MNEKYLIVLNDLIVLVLLKYNPASDWLIVSHFNGHTLVVPGWDTVLDTSYET